MNEYIQHHHNQKSAENPWQIVAFISEWTMDSVVLLYKSLEKIRSMRTISLRKKNPALKILGYFC